ncbi:MAG: hypothetical protein M1839_002908 [Geoglossum umbratile]|nr:MAG: hypothetical protein M1839_002908 [Geoglossum umbratile]
MAELALEEDLEGRPAKKARFEPPMPEFPGTPVIDDMDDASIYGTPSNALTPQTGQESEATAIKDSAGDPSKPASLEAPSNGIPGLGLLGSSTQIYYQAPTPEGDRPGASLGAVEQNEKNADGIALEYRPHDLDLKQQAIEGAVDVIESIEGGDVGKVDTLGLPDGRDETSVLDLSEGLLDNGIGQNAPNNARAILDPEFLQTAEVNKGDESAEWRLDSSDVESSSSSSEGSGSSDDSEADNEDEDDYQLLDPEEQAKILMRGDDGSDDEGANKKGKAASDVQLRTKNEIEDVKVIRPDINITGEMKIEELGEVDKIVDNLVLIKAKVSGDYQVLDSGSLLCSEDRRVVGVVSETLGRVQQPLYSVAFNSAAQVTEEGVAVGMKVFYVEQHSSYVFTQPLKAMKGSDASNLHDEEIGEDELEFSDDEAEAEHKRRVKLEKQSLKDARNLGSGPNGRRGPKGGWAERSKHRDFGNNTQEGSVATTDLDGDGPYTPLARPANMHELMGWGETAAEGRNVWAPTDRGIPGDRGRAGGRGGRGGWGSRGARGGEWRGRARGTHDYRRNDPPRERFDRLDSSPQSPQYGVNMAAFNNGLQSPTAGPYLHLPQSPQYPSHPQFPQPFQPTYDHQPNYSWPHPPISSQYPFAFYPSPQGYFPQSPSATITSPVGTLPPGSFVNPAFVRNQQPGPWVQQQQQPMSPPPQQSQSGAGRMSPEAEAAFKAAQERLDILKELSGVSGRGHTG